MKIKLLILTISTILFLCIAEFAIRFYLSQFQSSKLHNAISITSSQVIAGLVDTNFENIEGNTQREILAIGDSYTNGGNVALEETYPYQLWLALDKKITVKNLGVCESSTSEAFQRLKHFLTSQDYDPTKQYTILWLVGAADIFSKKMNAISDANSSFRYFDWNTISKNLIKFDSKIFKLIKYTYLYLKSHTLQMLIDTFISYYKDTHSTYQQFAICAQENCPFDELIPAEHLYLFYRRYFGQHGQNPEVAVKLLSKIITQRPEVLVFVPEFFFDLAANFTLQSTIPNQVFLDLAKSLDQQNITLNDETKRAISASLQWIKNKELATKNRLKYLAELHKIVIDHKNLSLILITYPLPYEINSEIRAFSAKKNLKLIELESIFSNEQKTRTHLLDDWQHCTEEGYQLMAESIAPYLYE